MWISITLRIVLVFCLSTSAWANSRLTVDFILPDKPGNAFWTQFNQFMQAAAEDLNIQLNIHYTQGNRYNALKLAKKIINRKDRTDYLVYIYQAAVGKKILELAEANQINSFIINTDILPNDKAAIGSPREKYKYWLGHMFPNDRQAGKLLSSYLIEAAKSRWPNSETQMLAISGGRDSTASLERNKGLFDAVRRDSSTELKQLVFAQWDSEVAKRKARVLLGRYPKVRAIWAASDAMAIGAHNGKSSSNNDILLGGIDWTPAGLKAIKSGTLSASVGGHFMEGGWALVMLYDHFHGHDFGPANLSIQSNMHLLHQDNVGDYVEKVSDRDFRNIDFSAFSQHINKGLESYDFSLGNLIRSLTPTANSLRSY